MHCPGTPFERSGENPLKEMVPEHPILIWPNGPRESDSVGRQRKLWSAGEVVGVGV